MREILPELEYKLLLKWGCMASSCDGRARREEGLPKTSKFEAQLAVYSISYELLITSNLDSVLAWETFEEIWLSTLQQLDNIEQPKHTNEFSVHNYGSLVLIKAIKNYYIYIQLPEEKSKPLQDIPFTPCKQKPEETIPWFMLFGIENQLSVSERWPAELPLDWKPPHITSKRSWNLSEVKTTLETHWNT